MPTFEITSPDGKTYEVTGPEGATKEQALEKVKAQHGAAPADQPSSVGDFFKSIPRGLAEGMGSFVSLGSRMVDPESAMQMGMTGQDPFAMSKASGEYTDKAVKGAIETAQEKTGLLPEPQTRAGRFGRTVGEFAGNPLSYVGPGGLPLKAGGAIASALTSEAAGQLTEGHPSIEPWARVLGAVVGGAGVAKGVGAVEHIASPGTQAAADLRRAILRDGDTPEALSAKLTEMQKIRPDATLADVGGENVRGLVERVAQTPGAGRTIVTPALTERQQAQMSRVSSDLSELTGSNKTATKALEETMDARKIAADPLYDQARNFNARANPEIMQAWDKETAGGFGKKILNSGEFKDTLQTEYGIADATNAPMMVVIDTWKKVADDMVKSAVSGGNNNTARVIGNMRDRVLAVVDKANPAYPQAREAWGGPSRYMDSIADGKNILSPKVTAEELAAQWAGMTDADKEAYRIGAMSAIKGKMGNDPAKMADMTKYLR
jgi:hypothetical protein